MHSGSVSPMRITVDRRKCWRVYITMLNAFISRRFETRLHAVDLHTVSWSDMMLTTVVVFFLLWRVGLLTPRATSLPRPHTNTLLTSITRVLTHTWITPHLPTHPLTHTHTHTGKSTPGNAHSSCSLALQCVYLSIYSCLIPRKEASSIKKKCEVDQVELTDGVTALLSVSYSFIFLYLFL